MSKRSKKYPLPEGLAGVADLERERRLRKQKPWPNPADIAMGGQYADLFRGSQEAAAEDGEKRALEAERNTAFIPTPAALPPRGGFSIHLAPVGSAFGTSVIPSRR